MIRITRGPVPEFLLSERVQRAKAQMAEDYRRLESIEAIQRSILPSLRELRMALEKEFNNKCAFCESRVGVSSPSEVELFRPRMRARGVSGDVSPDHYWWLSFEWQNLYCACPACNRLKGSRFPVEGARAEIGTTDPERLREERPLLLDPCFDDPAEHLQFDPEGLVYGRTPQGLTTIDVFGLNREQLVAERRAIVEQITTLIESDAHQAAQALADDSAPYAAIARQFLIQRELESSGEPPMEKEMAQTQQAQHSKSVDEYVVSNKTDETAAAYFAKTRYIERIEIENFKIIDKLDLKLPEGQASTAPWTMFLGENGVGKSTILQAMALALLTDEDRRKLVADERIDARRFVRYDQPSGYVRIHFVGDTIPLELTFSQESPEFRSTSDSKVLSLAYGATRLPCRPGHPAPPSAGFSKAVNLFNPFVPLVEIAPWLETLNPEEDGPVFHSLKETLRLKENEDLKVIPGDPPVAVITGEGHDRELSTLSDGYHSMVGLVADIMSVMNHWWEGRSDEAEGIVMIDEIGAHLHPQWKLKAVSNLRRLLPRVQIFATTHDPLCLWGLKQGEVVVVGKDEDESFDAQFEGLPDPSSMSVQQLLTSSFFGLRSTLSPDVADRIDRYQILLRRETLTEAEQVEVNDTKSFLRSTEFLANTPHQELLYDTIDELMAKWSDPETMPSPEERPTAAAAAAKYWANAEVPQP